MKEFHKTIASLCLITFIMGFSISIYAMSLTKDVVANLKAEGKLDAAISEYKDAQKRGLDAPNPEPYRFDFVATDLDTIHGIVILVDFNDNQKQAGYDSNPDDFVNLLFSSGEHPTGSMRDYYWETSYQHAVVIGDVVGWYRMPEAYSYYVDGQRGFGAYPRNAQKLAEDAVLAADPDVDFTLYDNDGDGQVDALFVIHAGPGYEDTGNPNYIHSHAWSMSYSVPVDGIYARGYSMEPEETGSGALVNMGVFGHEFGHVLGLPDLYDTDYSSDGLGDWSMMSGGSWGNGGRTPVHFDVWCKYELGWLNPTTLIDNLRDANIPAIEVNPQAYRLWYHGEGGAEYFLVENRQKMLFDSYLPGAGTLVYHIDETRWGNDNEDRYKVGLEQADGKYDHENGRGSDAGDPYPGTSDNRTFDDFSVPDAWNYWGDPTEVAVWNIGDSDSIISANLDVEYDRPLISLASYSFDDASGNGNGRPEGGETVTFNFSLTNQRSAAFNATMTVSADTSAVNLIDNSSHWDNIPAFSGANNSSDPIIFSLPEGFGVTWVTFDLQFVSNDGTYQRDFQIQFLTGLPMIVLIDDDGAVDVDQYYTSALDAVGLPYDLWDINSKESTGYNLLDYKVAIWFTGNNSTSPSLTAENIQDIENFLNAGDKGLFITSQDVAQTLTERGTPQDIEFLQNYLKINYDGLSSDHILDGEPGDIIGDGFKLATAGAGGASNQISQDAIAPVGDASICYRYSPSQIAGTYHSVNAAKVVVFGFGFEAINGEVNGYNSRPEVIYEILAYLTGVTDVPELDPVGSLPKSFALHQNYPNPFNPITRISFHLIKAGEIDLSIYNLIGQKVATLVGGKMEGGHHTVVWDGANNSSGIYFYKLNAGDKVIAKRMTLLK